MAIELSDLSAGIFERFTATNGARDRALTDGRQLTRLCANSVRAIHRGEYEEASALLRDAADLLRSIVRALDGHPSVYWQGYVQDPMKEFAEANITLAMVRYRAIPTPEEIGVEDAPYLNGLAEAASELRREVLDAMRKGDLERSEALLATMESIYDLLVTIDFPDGITGGLRRTTDALRAVLERTRNDLTLTLTQHRLERALREAEETFRSAGQGS